MLKVIDAFQRNQSKQQFQRVVLVEFPHPGMKVPGFVTSTCTDRLTGETILCVYVPTTPVPTSGYMLLVPERSVLDLSWDVQETIQAIVSGGITVPQYVDYHSSPLAGPTTLSTNGPPVTRPWTRRHSRRLVAFGRDSPRLLAKLSVL
ncbi:MAG: DUF502 domain-containing protein [Pirellulaceae bacterium]